MHALERPAQPLVEPHIMAARDCLMNETPPAPATKCPHCSFAAERLAHAAKAN